MDPVLTTVADRFWQAADYFQAGGPVMIPLAAASVWLWLLIFFKLKAIYDDRRQVETDGEELDLPKGLGGRLTKWQAGLLSDFLSQRTRSPEADQKLLESLRLRQSARLERHVGTILVLASIAPLIGLLGTVTGMITTFDVISYFGTGNAKALSRGISEALITTQTGLVVAVPGLFLGNFIRRQVDRMKMRLERFCLSLNNAPALAVANDQPAAGC